MSYSVRAPRSGIDDKANAARRRAYEAENGAEQIEASAWG